MSATNGNGAHKVDLLSETVVPCVVDNAVFSGASSSYACNDPHTGEKLYDVASVTVEDCAAVVESAQKAYKTWKNTGAAERRKIFNKAADLMTERKDEFVKLAMSETTANGFWG